MATPDSPRHESEVAMWHRLSGLPDNVTGDGEIVDESGRRRRAQTDKELLRAEIRHLRQNPGRVGGLARLAASYLLAGDVETARRYAAAAREALG